MSDLCAMDCFAGARNDVCDYPTGKSPRLRSSPNYGLSSPFCKNISVFQKLDLGYMICHPVPLRGALANVINA